MKKNRTIFRVVFILIFCFVIHEIHASASNQQPDNKFKVTGTVVDSSGETIVGASVAEKGSTNGTLTDVNGGFTIKVSPNSTLAYFFYRISK